MLTLSKLTGKMEGMGALSTDPTNNKFCIAMSKDCKSICSKCYAMRYIKLRPNVGKAYKKNSKILIQPIAWDDLPIIREKYFRFNSFGEILNNVNFENYLSIARKNPKTNFALFTKRASFGILYKGELPKNLFLVYSSHIINDPKPFVPLNHAKVFSVYTKDYARDNKIQINCGTKKCIDCKVCYTKNKVTQIRELIK